MPRKIGKRPSQAAGEIDVLRRGIVGDDGDEIGAAGDIGHLGRLVARVHQHADVIARAHAECHQRATRLRHPRTHPVNASHAAIAEVAWL